MNPVARRAAVVTGASSGIGRATALLLAREGYFVALVARRLDLLHALSQQIAREGGRAVAINADLSQESGRYRAYRIIHRCLPPIDVVVNNAGVGWYGHATEMAWQTARELIQLNVEAVAQTTLLFLREMYNRGRGHIISVGSIAGGIPSQGVAMYGASKAFLDNFMTALHRESQGTGVRVSVVRPGPVRTGFGLAARRQPHAMTVPTERIGVSPEQVARAIGGLIRRPRRVVYVPWWLQAVPWTELSFGWLIDRIGPLLLRSQSGRAG